MCEGRSSFHQTVKMRCFDLLMTQRRNRVIGHVIRENKENIGLLPPGEGQAEKNTGGEDGDEGFHGLNRTYHTSFAAVFAIPVGVGSEIVGEAAHRN